MKRPYDQYMPEIVRDRAEARRIQPDGVCHPLRVVTRGPRREEHYEYPWAKMKLGDFFFVPLRGRAPGALAIRFRQIAARKDWELAVCKVDVAGDPNLRVCLTVLDVSNYKQQKSDGRWLEQRKARYRKNKERKTATTIKGYMQQMWDDTVDKVQKGEIPILVAVPPSSSGRTSAFEADDVGSSPAGGTTEIKAPKSVAVDASLSPDYDRDEIVKQRLAQLGISR